MTQETNTETKENQRVLRLRDVIRRVGLQRASIYRQVASGNFPAPIAIGIRARGWLESDISRWIASRVSTRQNVQ